MEKAKASDKYLALKKTLNDDHLINKIKEEQKEIIMDMECEDIPNEHTRATKNDSTFY